MDAHLLRAEFHHRRGAFFYVFAMAQFVDRNCRFVAMRDRPDDVLRSECGIPAEEHIGNARLHRDLIDDGHAPSVEFETDVALDPWKRIFLPDRHQYVVALHQHVRLTGGYQLAMALGVVCSSYFLKHDAAKLAVLVFEFQRHQKIENGNAFVLRVFFLPRRGFHFLKAAAYDHFDFLAAEPLRRTAAVHRGIAAAEHNHALADFIDMSERHAGEPVDADMNIFCRFFAPRNVEIAPARRAGADEDRIVFLGEQLFKAVDEAATLELDADIEDIADFLVDHGFGQPKFRNLRADHSAGLRVAIEYCDLIAERCEITRDGERCRSRANQRNALAVFLGGRFRQTFADVFLVVGSDALKPADRNGLRFAGSVCRDRHTQRIIFLDATAAACRFARAVAGAAQNPGENV